MELSSDIFTMPDCCLRSPDCRVRAGNSEADLLNGLGHSLIIRLNGWMHNQVNLHCGRTRKKKVSGRENATDKENSNSSV